MAQSVQETAKDIVVALLGRVKEFSTTTLQNDSTKIGKAIAELYKEVLSEVKKL